MRAAVITAGAGFDVVDVPDPEPAPGELVLRVRACGICGSDLKTVGIMPPGTVLGHEFCGEVVATGPGVDPRWDGRLAAAMPLRACGTCAACQRGDVTRCTTVELLGLGAHAGAFAEYVRVSAATSFALPPDVGDLGAVVEPLAVGLHAVDAARLAPGDRILVVGGGTVGAAVTVWARRLGAGEVVVSDPVEARREDAARFGATGVHDPSTGPVESGFDVVIECVGGAGMTQVALDAAATQGRVVVAGLCLVPDRIIPLGALMKELTLRWAVYYSRREFALAAALLADGTLDAAPFVSTRVGLEDVAEAFAAAAGGTQRKVLVTPGRC